MTLTEVLAQWMARAVFALLLMVVVLLAAVSTCSCAPAEVEAWTPVIRELVIAAVAIVGLNLHRNRTRRKAMEKLRK